MTGEKKLTVDLKFENDPPILDLELIGNKITQDDFVNIWNQIKTDSEKWEKRTTWILRINFAIFFVLAILGLLTLLNFISGTFPILSLLLLHGGFLGILWYFLRIKKTPAAQRSTLARLNLEYQSRGIKFDITHENKTDSNANSKTRVSVLEISAITDQPSADSEGMLIFANYYRFFQITLFSL